MGRWSVKKESESYCLASGEGKGLEGKPMAGFAIVHTGDYGKGDDLLRVRIGRRGLIFILRPGESRAEQFGSEFFTFSHEKYKKG